MHLMTKEAFDIYLAHLATDGILAVNFEFEMFEMAPLHRGMAKRFGMDVRWFDPKGGDGCEGAISWALYTRDKAFFEAPHGQGRGLPLARRRQPARPGLDRQRQQPDEHHQLARRGHGRAGAGIGPPRTARRRSDMRWARAARVANVV